MLRTTRIGRRLRLSTLLLPVTFFVLLLVLPLNRRSDILLEDIEDKLHVPHVHHVSPGRAGRPPVGQGGADEPPKREAKTLRHRSGLLTLDDSELPYLRRHPIETLIAEAKKKAAIQEARVPSSLDTAIALYQELNAGAFPPLGFDKWCVGFDAIVAPQHELTLRHPVRRRFDFCIEHDIKPWPHQTAYHAVEPYLSIPGAVLRARQSELDDRDVTSLWTFRFALRACSTLRERARSRLTVGVSYTQRRRAGTRTIKFRADHFGSRQVSCTQMPGPASKREPPLIGDRGRVIRLAQDTFSPS